MERVLVSNKGEEANRNDNKEGDYQMNPPYTIEDIKKFATPIAQRFGVEKMAIFGSCAKGEANETSDIDFLIKKGKIRGMFAFCEFANCLEDELRTNADVLTYDQLSKELSYVIEEAVVLYES